VTIFGRYSQSPQSSQNYLPTSSRVQYLDGDTRTLTLGMNAAFSANLTNEFRFNWSRNSSVNTSGFRSFNGTTPVVNPLEGLANLTENSQILFTLPGGGSYFKTSGNKGLRKQINVTDTLTWVMGNHLFKFGVDYRQSPTHQEFPDLTLSALFTSLTAVQTAHSSSVSFVINNPRFNDYKWKNFGSFVQDTWRIAKRLTLDYGVRWDVNPPPIVTPERRLVIVDYVNPIRFADPGAELYPTIWNAFAPRIGAAYQLSTKNGWQTVLRGGYGLFYDDGSGSNGSVSGNYTRSRQPNPARIFCFLSTARL
jgi:hypothetical protein